MSGVINSIQAVGYPVRLDPFWLALRLVYGPDDPPGRRALAVALTSPDDSSRPIGSSSFDVRPGTVSVYRPTNLAIRVEDLEVLTPGVMFVQVDVDGERMRRSSSSRSLLSRSPARKLRDAR